MSVAASRESFNEIRAVGHNTDADAIARAIREDLEFEFNGARVVITGMGGAGRVAALRLAQEPLESLWLVNRTEEKARLVAEEIQARAPGAPVRVGYPDGDVDLVVNGTSLGLKGGDALPIDLARFSLSQATHCFDMIYQPAETALLTRAKDGGLKTANGLGMLLYQGASALEIWTERAAPIDAMRAALIRHIYGERSEG